MASEIIRFRLKYKDDNDLVFGKLQGRVERLEAQRKKDRENSEQDSESASRDGEEDDSASSGNEGKGNEKDRVAKEVAASDVGPSSGEKLLRETAAIGMRIIEVPRGKLTEYYLESRFKCATTLRGISHIEDEFGTFVLPQNLQRDCKGAPFVYFVVLKPAAIGSSVTDEMLLYEGAYALYVSGVPAAVTSADLVEWIQAGLADDDGRVRQYRLAVSHYRERIALLESKNHQGLSMPLAATAQSPPVSPPSPGKPPPTSTPASADNPTSPEAASPADPSSETERPSPAGPKLVEDNKKAAASGTNKLRAAVAVSFDSNQLFRQNNALRNFRRLLKKSEKSLRAREVFCKMNRIYVERCENGEEGVLSNQSNEEAQSEGIRRSTEIEEDAESDKFFTWKVKVSPLILSQSSSPTKHVDGSDLASPTSRKNVHSWTEGDINLHRIIISKNDWKNIFLALGNATGSRPPLAGPLPAPAKAEPYLVSMLSATFYLSRNGRGASLQLDEELKIYIGDWKDNTFHGKGVLYSSRGLSRGWFESGSLSGIATCEYPSSDVYKGECRKMESRRLPSELLKFNLRILPKHQDLPSSLSSGKPDADSKAPQTGSLVGTDVMTLNGKGCMNFADGSVYTGEFFQGRVCGKGKYINGSGDVWEGVFKDGVLHGEGRYQGANGEEITGFWQNGTLEGVGRTQNLFGEVMEGWFEDGRLQGRGSLHGVGEEEESFCFIGYFNNGYPHGRGNLLIGTSKLESNTELEPTETDKEKYNEEANTLARPKPLPNVFKQASRIKHKFWVEGVWRGGDLLRGSSMIMRPPWVSAPSGRQGSGELAAEERISRHHHNSLPRVMFPFPRSLSCSSLARETLTRHYNKSSKWACRRSQRNADAVRIARGLRVGAFLKERRIALEELDRYTDILTAKIEELESKIRIQQSNRFQFRGRAGSIRDPDARYVVLEKVLQAEWNIKKLEKELFELPRLPLMKVINEAREVYRKEERLLKEVAARSERKKQGLALKNS